MDKKVINFIVDANVPFGVVNRDSFKMLFGPKREELKEEHQYRRILPKVFYH